MRMYSDAMARPTMAKAQTELDLGDSTLGSVFVKHMFTYSITSIAERWSRYELDNFPPLIMNREWTEQVDRLEGRS